MRAVIQKVSHASVSVSGKVISQIGPGLLVLVAATHADAQQDVDYLAQKICRLRIMNDLENKMNLSIKDTQGEVLVISQFTLYGNTRKGNRPSFIQAATPEIALPLYKSFIKKVIAQGITVKAGQFGAMMQVELINDGPVTIIIDSQNR